MSSAGTGKFAAALLMSTSGSPKPLRARSKAAAICSGSRMSQPTVSTLPPMSSMAFCPSARWSGLRLAMTMDAPSRLNSPAMALPRPVPAPVTKTVLPSYVPGGSALAPRSGGSGSPCAMPSAS